MDTFKTLADRWKTRKAGDEDLIYYKDLGGDQWLFDSLKTSADSGIDSSTIQAREAVYLHNKKDKIIPKTFLELCWEAMDDLILWILFAAGIFSMIINPIVEEHDRSTAWIEGFAILIAVAIVVLVTAYNDL